MGCELMKIEINATTGEVIEREYTDAEVKQEKKDHAEFAKIRAAEKAEAETKELARQAILDRLGLTADEAKLILG